MTRNEFDQWRSSSKETSYKAFVANVLWPTLLIALGVNRDKKMTYQIQYSNKPRDTANKFISCKSWLHLSALQRMNIALWF